MLRVTSYPRGAPPTPQSPAPRRLGKSWFPGGERWVPTVSLGKPSVSVSEGEVDETLSPDPRVGPRGHLGVDIRSAARHSRVSGYRSAVQEVVGENSRKQDHFLRFGVH